MGYLYIAGTIFFTVYGQLILKWRMSQKGALPKELADIAVFMFKLFLDPFIISGFASAFIASLFWMAAMTKFQVSYAYPFMSLAFVLVLLLSTLLLGEALTLGKVLGLAIIILGIVITVKL
jgi:drug/metabolite transporter (DMT)-like permease